MAPRIEDYALIGDLETAALVGRDGSIDWLCLPRFDSAPCFAALLGTADHGRWAITPGCAVTETRRRYRDDTLILETEFDTECGGVTVIDFMPLRMDRPDLVRIVVGRSGEVPMHTEIAIRYDYGSIVPWVRKTEDGIFAVAGPDAVHLHSDVPLHGEDLRTVADFTVSEGDRVGFVLTWYRSHEDPPRHLEPEEALTNTAEWWEGWSSKCTYRGRWSEAVVRSLITLKALTYAPTGGLVAAPTTSLPEQWGGSRNWDYRYCWIRDATFTLYSLMMGGYVEEAAEWRDWLIRAVAGSPWQIQALYGIAGERRLPEFELDWLPGFADSSPVRVGNAACNQFQLDVFGELMDAMHFARRRGMSPDENAWRIQKELMKELADVWHQPDEGIWEVRGDRKHFVHSKVMAWVAADRAVKAVEQHGLDGPADKWRKLRQSIHQDVCKNGFSEELNSFVQSYDSNELDAAVLIIPYVGFLPIDDRRVQGTVEAVQRHLMEDGLVRRYAHESGVDGLEGGEGAFLLCTCWLADNLAMMGRHEEAEELFERILSLRNDVGLLAEEYDAADGRQLGNFPQAFSHIGLINTACNLSADEHPSEDRAQT